MSRKLCSGIAHPLGLILLTSGCAIMTMAILSFGERRLCASQACGSVAAAPSRIMMPAKRARMLEKFGSAARRHRDGGKDCRRAAQNRAYAE